MAGTGTPRSSWLREGAPPPVAARRGFPWAGARGSPCARGYKSAAPRQRATGRQPPAMSRGLQLLLLSCGRARDPLSPPSSPPPQTAPTPVFLLTLPFFACSRRCLPLAACSLAPAAREVKVACSEDVDLPCTAPRDPQVSYKVFWAKVSAAMPASWGLVGSIGGSGNHLTSAGDLMWLGVVASPAAEFQVPSLPARLPHPRPHPVRFQVGTQADLDLFPRTSVISCR